MEQANKLYLQYLEDARNLAKVGQDVPTLKKAEVFAQIATAIAATGFVTEDVFGDNKAAVPEKVAAGKDALERKPEPKKAVGKAKPETLKQAPEPEPAAPAVPEWLTSTEFNELKELEKEPADKHAERISYLLAAYGSKQMKELSPEVFPFFHLEGRELDLMKYYLKTWNADVERWTIKAATEISENRVTTIGELTVEEYLNKLIPAIGHLNYILSFEKDQHAELMEVINKVSRGSVKKIEDIRFRAVAFIRIAVDKYIDGNFDEVEKVS